MNKHINLNYTNLLVVDNHKSNKFLSYIQHVNNKILSDKRKHMHQLGVFALINLFVLGFYRQVSQTLKNLTCLTKYPNVKELMFSGIYINLVISCLFLFKIYENISWSFTLVGYIL
jgi:hypothetical protein